MTIRDMRRADITSRRSPGRSSWALTYRGNWPRPTDRDARCRPPRAPRSSVIPRSSWGPERCGAGRGWTGFGHIAGTVAGAPGSAHTVGTDRNRGRAGCAGTGAGIGASRGSLRKCSTGSAAWLTNAWKIGVSSESSALRLLGSMTGSYTWALTFRRDLVKGKGDRPVPFPAPAPTRGSVQRQRASRAEVAAVTGIPTKQTNDPPIEWPFYGRSGTQTTSRAVIGAKIRPVATTELLTRWAGAAGGR